MLARQLPQNHKKVRKVVMFPALSDKHALSKFAACGTAAFRRLDREERWRYVQALVGGPGRG